MATTSHTFEIDPNAVLGVPVGASLEQIREAYRAKALKHHPDHGGDEWAFRIVARAYEVLGAARIAGKAALDLTPAGTPVREAPAKPSTGNESQWLQPGRKDPGIDRLRMVDVEMLILRYELRNPLEIIQLPPEQRSLSCSLNVSWAPPAGAASERDVSKIRDALSKAFKTTAAKSRAMASWSSLEDERFEAWLSYPTANRAWEAFQTLHQALNRDGIGVNQWTREMLIPRGG